MARTAPAARVAMATNRVARCVRTMVKVCLVASRNPASRAHSRNTAPQPVRSSSRTALKSVLQTELDLPHRCCKRSDHPSRARPIIDEVIRLSEVRVIQHVEKLRAKLEPLRLGGGELLANGTVKAVHARSDEDVTT